MRVAAAIALGQLNAVGYQERLSDFLDPKREKSRRVRTSVAEALGNLERPKRSDSRVFRALWECYIHDESPWARFRAAQTLEALGDKRIQAERGELLQTLKESADAKERQAAARKLAVWLNDTMVVQALIQRAGSDQEEDSRVRAEALTTLATAYRETRVHATNLDKIEARHRASLANDPSWRGRHASARALGYAEGSDRNLRVLGRHLSQEHERSREVRLACARALRRLKAVDLLRASHDPLDEAIVKEVATAISNVRSTMLAELLRSGIVAGGRQFPDSRQISPAVAEPNREVSPAEATT